jgi:Flp pilus assembly protein CpaB
MSTQSTLIIFAIVAAALGLIGVVAVNIILISEEAEAKGCRNSVAANAKRKVCQSWP